VFLGDSGADTGETPTTPTKPSGTADNAAATAALNQAKAAYAAANTALTKGDLATYQAKVKEAQAAVDRAITALGG
jgi:multidrug resistance efflux pump